MLQSLAVVTALVVGFLTGLLSFKVKSRWCWRCGTTTSRYVSGRRNQGRYRG